MVADSQHSFELTGNGDVLEPEHGAIGEYLLLSSSCLCGFNRLFDFSQLLDLVAATHYVRYGHLILSLLFQLEFR